MGACKIGVLVIFLLVGGIIIYALYAIFWSLPCGICAWCCQKKGQKGDSSKTSRKEGQTSEGSEPSDELQKSAGSKDSAEVRKSPCAEASENCAKFFRKKKKSKNQPDEKKSTKNKTLTDNQD